MLDTEDYFKKERICEIETITATFTQYHAWQLLICHSLSLSCMMVLNASYNLLNVTGIKQQKFLLSLASNALIHCAH